MALIPNSNCPYFFDSNCVCFEYLNCEIDDSVQFQNDENFLSVVSIEFQCLSKHKKCAWSKIQESQEVDSSLFQEAPDYKHVMLMMTLSSSFLTL